MNFSWNSAQMWSLLRCAMPSTLHCCSYSATSASCAPICGGHCTLKLFCRSQSTVQVPQHHSEMLQTGLCGTGLMLTHITTAAVSGRPQHCQHDLIEKLFWCLLSYELLAMVTTIHLFSSSNVVILCLWMRAWSKWCHEWQYYKLSALGIFLLFGIKFQKNFKPQKIQFCAYI